MSLGPIWCRFDKVRLGSDISWVISRSAQTLVVFDVDLTCVRFDFAESWVQFERLVRESDMGMSSV